MKVLKFGGTSVGSAQCMKDVAKLICDGNRKIVVLSAMAGTTNTLVEISDYLYKKNTDGARETIGNLERKYNKVIDELYSTDEYKQKTLEVIKGCFDHIRSFTKDLFTLFEEKVILAQGELMSTAMMNNYLLEQGVKSVIIPALDYMRTDKNSEPDNQFIKNKLLSLLQESPDAEIYITQGYICRNAYGEIDNLQRGGSYYSASLIGAAINSEEIKILHPTCVLPAKLNNIPVRLLNTMQPEAPGTLIYDHSSDGQIKAIAAKENITAIKIKSGRMLLAYGFLRKVFEIFESYQTSIDMVTTSEVGVSLTIDNTKHLQEILDDLRKFGTVTVDEDMVIICVVGDLEWNNVGFESEAVQAMKDIPVRMISYGGSNYNISFLVRREDKVKALRSLRYYLFENK